MPFKEVVAAGVFLVREALRSPNYVMGVAGWTINRDGSAEFNNVIVRGTVTGAIFQSSNYVPGVSGFQLNGTAGTVEFNGPVTINGNTVVSGNIQSANWVSQTTGYKLFGATGNAEFNGDVDLYASGNLTIHDGTNTVSVQNSGGVGGIYFNPGGSQALGSITATGGSPSTIALRTPRPTDPPGVDFPPKVGMDWESGRNAGGKDFYGEIRMFTETPGDPIGAAISVPTLRGDSPWSLLMPDMQHMQDSDGTGRSTTSTTYVLASSVASVTVPNPASHKITVTVSADISNNGANNSRISYQIREDNAAGTVLIPGSDSRAALHNGTVQETGSVTFTHGGLTGASIYIEPQFRATAGTASFDNIKIVVIPSP